MPAAFHLFILITLCAAACTTNPAAPPSETTPAALVDGQPIYWEQLRPPLAELAGSQALEEAVLDRLLTTRCIQQRITIDPAAIAAERARLIESLDPDPDRAETLLAQIRSARRLGEYRFNATLRRSAMLRALVGPPALPPGTYEAAVRRRFEERATLRILTLPTEAQAASLRATLTTPIDPMHFAALAAQHSTDESAQRGGLIDPIGKDDPEIPASLRRAVWETPPGSLTPIIATESGFVTALVLSRTSATDGSITREDVRRVTFETVDLVNTRWQRLEMERLAQRLLSEASIVPMDRSLNWSWEQRGK